MNIKTVFTRVVAERYAAHNAVLHPIIQEEWRQLYRVDRADSSPWLLRAYSYPHSNDRQAQQVKVLTLLEKYNYPAPRLVYSQDSRAVVEAVSDEVRWYVVITTFVEGNVLEGDLPDTLALLGEALGQFHAFSTTIPTGETQALSVALWRPAEAIPFALAHMNEVVPATPTLDHVVHRMVQHAVASIPSFIHLPEGLNHGDCVPTNAVITSEKQLILIDWADAGRGTMLLDLAWLLLMGMGGIPGEAEPIAAVAPDPIRLCAVIRGYYRYRRLTEAECTMLVDALRFVPAFYSALEFCAACRGERSVKLWQAWWARYQVAPAAAALVEQYTARHCA